MLKKLSLIALCIATATASYAATPSSSTEKSQGSVTKHVLLIGIDGVRQDAFREAINNMDCTTHPFLCDTIHNGKLDYLMYSGGRADKYPQKARSAPGWTTILTGTWFNQHNIPDNPTPGIEQRELELEYNHDIPTIFNLAKNFDSSTYNAALSSWIPIQVISGFTYQGPGPDLNAGFFCHKVPCYQFADRHITQDAEHLLSGLPSGVVFLYYGQVDEAGHTTGFDPNESSKYYAHLNTALDEINGVLGTVDQLRKQGQEWLTVLVTDHGGHGKDHGKETDSHGNPVRYWTDGEIFTVLYDPQYPSGPSDIYNNKTGQYLDDDFQGQTAITPTILQYLGIPYNTQAFGRPFENNALPVAPIYGQFAMEHPVLGPDKKPQTFQLEDNFPFPIKDDKDDHWPGLQAALDKDPHARLLATTPVGSAKYDFFLSNGTYISVDSQSRVASNPKDLDAQDSDFKGMKQYAPDVLAVFPESGNIYSFFLTKDRYIQYDVKNHSIHESTISKTYPNLEKYASQIMTAFHYEGNQYFFLHDGNNHDANYVVMDDNTHAVSAPKAISETWQGMYPYESLITSVMPNIASGQTDIYFFTKPMKYNNTVVVSLG